MPLNPPAPPVGTADEAEAEFYDALQHGDLDRLMAVWSDDDDIVCVHPGGPRIVGAAAIRASFAEIFAHAGAVPARPEQVRRVETLSSAVHSVVERVQAAASGPADAPGPDAPGEGFVVATNVYVRGARGWRLVAHHASPSIAVVYAVAEGPPSTLH